MQPDIFLIAKAIYDTINSEKHDCTKISSPLDKWGKWSMSANGLNAELFIPHNIYNKRPFQKVEIWDYQFCEYIMTMGKSHA